MVLKGIKVFMIEIIHKAILLVNEKTKNGKSKKRQETPVTPLEKQD